MLSKLSIQGIRSFGADHDEKLDFFSPLTLILGQNGTGKTTIIECLKYITTGVLPPGTKGGAFVHDPKLDNTSEVKGQIKLQFKGGTNNFDCHSQRSMAVTMKGSKPTFRSIDGYLRVKEPGKDPKTISMKCGDLDHEMCALLGVSKPVLEHVIFCHQEESNWPLGEGKALKQKFDDIFASGRYAKALDTMLKLQKESNADINNLKTHDKYLKEKKMKACEINSKLDNLQTQLMRTDDAIAMLEKQLKPIQDELKRLDGVERQAYTVQTELSTISANHQVLLTQVGDLERVCPPERQRQGREDLEAELERLKTRSDDWRAETDRLSEKRARLTKRLEGLQAEKQRIAVRERELEMLNRQVEEKKSKKARLCSQMIELLGEAAASLPSSSGSSFTSQFEETSGLRRLIEDEIYRLASKKTELVGQFDCEEETVEKDLNEATGRRAYLENLLREKERERSRHETELRRLSTELQDVNTSQARARQLTNDIVDAERKLANAEASINGSDLESEFNDLLAQKAKVAQEQQQLTQQLSRAHRAVEVEAKLNFLKRNRGDKEDRLAELEKKIRHQMAMHDDANTAGVDRLGLYDSLEKKLTILRDNLPASERELEALRNSLASNSNNVESSKKRLADCNRELEKIRARVRSQLGSCDEQVQGVEELDGRIATLQENLENYQQELASVTSNENMMKGYIQLIETTITTTKTNQQPKSSRRGAAKDASQCHSSCPLCERPFQTESERTHVVTSIKSRLSSSLPEKQSQLRHDVADAKKRLDGLRTLKPMFADRQRLEAEASRLRQTIDDSQSQVDILKHETESVRSTVTALREGISEFSSLLSEAATLTQLSNDVADLDIQIDDCQQEITDMPGGRSTLGAGSSVQNLSAAQLSSKLERKALELKNIEEQIDLQQSRIREDRELVESLRDRLLKLRQDKVDLDSKQQKRCQLEADRERVDGDRQRTKQAVESARSEILPVGAKIQEAERRRADVRKRREAELRQFTERGQRLKDGQTRLQEVDDEIRRMMASSHVGGLGTIADRCSELEMDASRVASELDLVNADLSLATREVTEVTRSIEGQKAAERELQDAIMLQEKRGQLEEVAAKKVNLSNKLRSIVGVGKSLRDQQIDLRKQEAEFMREKIETEAHKTNLTEQLKQHRDLLSSDYKEAAKRYRDNRAELQVKIMANEDLKSYYKLVDMALLTFHKRKMKEINRIIGEIWQNTYKGGDIDTIEIQSDVDTTASEGQSKRRTYNYRVVMKKGDTALDMRGRCSAGQKVLASIIIRLALSEAFAGKCHILALDEPTTNLDRDNIESLAHALTKIIEIRAIRARNSVGHMSNENFQLIIITHDVDFLEILGRLSEFADQFYMLERDYRSETRIIRKSVTDLVSATPG